MLSYFVLGGATLLAFIISTLTGGGGSLMLIPLVTFYLGVNAVAPVMNLGNTISRPVRLYLFWKHIAWEIVWYYAPAAAVGAFLGVYVFTNLKAPQLQLVIGLFLISTIFQYRFGKKRRSFEVKRWYFIPAALLGTFMTSIIGALGPVMNIFYLNYGLKKEELIGTKVFQAFFAGLIQVSSFAFFGELKGDLWFYGIALGIGGAIGSYIGKRALHQISEALFQKLVIWSMVIIGIYLVANSIKEYYL